jgi:hypothetical protein
MLVSNVGYVISSYVSGSACYDYMKHVTTFCHLYIVTNFRHIPRLKLWLIIPRVNLAYTGEIQSVRHAIKRRFPLSLQVLGTYAPCITISPNSIRCGLCGSHYFFLSLSLMSISHIWEPLSPRAKGIILRAIYGNSMYRKLYDNDLPRKCPVHIGLLYINAAASISGLHVIN